MYGYIFASIVTLFCIVLLSAGMVTTTYNIVHNRPEKLYPMADGFLVAYVVAYFAFIYRG